jgi:hypothetical protein
VKPRSTIGFSRFLLIKFDEAPWVEKFWMTKPTLFDIVEKLQPMPKKQDTKYRKIIPIEI